MTTKSFNYDLIEVSTEPGFVFTLGGREWHCKAVDDIPWALVEDFFLAQAAGDMNGIVVNIDDMFRATLFDDEADDFMEMKNDPSSGVSYSRFSALLEDIVKEVFGTPTQRPVRSRTGPPANGRTTTAGSPPRASRSRRAG